MTLDTVDGRTAYSIILVICANERLIMPPKYRDFRCALLCVVFSYDPASGRITLRGNAIERPSSDGRYLTVYYSRTFIPAHILAWALMTGEWPADQIDHIDRDGTNNAWSNLRLASPSEQQANRGLFKNNQSGFRGVYRHGNKWRAQVRYNGKTYTLGTFSEPATAAAEVEQMRAKIWGNYAS